MGKNFAMRQRSWRTAKFLIFFGATISEEEKGHGKKLYRAQLKKRTANSLVCRASQKSARQRMTLPAPKKAHVKQ